MARFDSLIDWLRWQESFHPRSIDLGLKRASRVFNLLNPEGVKPTTIIVAGTNGKGSSIAFLETIYRAQGYRVGTYSSPHILAYNERIRIDGLAVDGSTICQAFERIDSVRDDISLSYFEFGTLAALDIFWRSELDVQLLEVGLGGRLDAVNIIDSDVALVTSISIDHVDWLGETREAIGFEKAGIFRENVVAVIGDVNPPESLLNSATEKNTPLSCINKEFNFKVKTNGWDWSCAGDKQREYIALPEPALKGLHQYQNAAAVLMAIVEMEKLLPVSEAAIHQGLTSVKLNGRFQLIDGNIPVLLDVAHNPQAVKALLDYLKDKFPDKKIHAVFSMMKDKDITSVINIIKPLIKHWFVAPLNTRRVASELVMRESFSDCGVKNVTFGYKNFSEAYHAAEKQAEKSDLILVFGSFFLVSEYLANARS